MTTGAPEIPEFESAEEFERFKKLTLELNELVRKMPRHSVIGEMRDIMWVTMRQVLGILKVHPTQEVEMMKVNSEGEDYKVSLQVHHVLMDTFAFLLSAGYNRALADVDRSLMVLANLPEEMDCEKCLARELCEGSGHDTCKPLQREEGGEGNGASEDVGIDWTTLLDGIEGIVV